MAVRRTGKWAAAQAALSGGGARLTRAIEQSVKREAQGLRAEIVMLIRNQEGFAALSPWTLAKRKLIRRGGTKALIQRGDLIGSINVVVHSSDLVFVGIPAAAKDRAGQELVRIGRVHEYGTDPTIIPVTPKMRRYLAMVARKMGRAPTPGAGKSAIVVQIPARPFLRPAFARWRVGVRRRIIRNIAKSMGWM